MRDLDEVAALARAEDRDAAPSATRLIRIRRDRPPSPPPRCNCPPPSPGPKTTTPHRAARFCASRPIFARSSCARCAATAAPPIAACGKTHTLFHLHRLPSRSATPNTGRGAIKKRDRPRSRGRSSCASCRASSRAGSRAAPRGTPPVHRASCRRHTGPAVARATPAAVAAERTRAQGEPSREAVDTQRTRVGDGEASETGPGVSIGTSQDSENKTRRRSLHSGHSVGRPQHILPC